MDRFALTKDEMEFLGYFTTPDGHEFTKGLSIKPQVYFLDCEMVETVAGPEVVLIGFGYFDNSTSNFDTTVLKVKPRHEVVDYITHVTGVDKDTVLDLSLDDAVKILLERINSNDYLLGHHMYTDLKLLNVYHQNVIDCGMVFHHPDGPPYFYSLKDLAKIHLKKHIQNGTHDPLEDGVTSFELIRSCVDKGYIKTHWKYIGQKFTPSVSLIYDALGVSDGILVGVYTRGSRAIGTNKPDSDYDIIVICNNAQKIINGTLTRYGNIDICIYTQNYFEQMLKDQIVWAIECIYCPPDMIYLEQIDFRKIFEKYRQINPQKSNQKLRKSVGFESSRKIASAKRHFLNKDYHHAKKHVFIAIRFVEYGRQIVLLNRLFDIKNANGVWEMLKDINLEEKTFEEFKQLWSSTYIELSREFSHKAPKALNNPEKSPIDVGTSKSYTSSDVLDCIETLKTLLDNVNIGKINQDLSINVHRSKRYPELVLLRYSNRTPDTVFKYVCRGIIFNVKTKQIVAYPFNNFIEVAEKTETLRIYEKIDGSFACLYYYDNCWNVSTSRNPDGDSVIGVRKKADILFSRLFWSVFERKGYDIKQLNTSYTYMFELVSKDHVIIVQYETDDLTLIGVRDLKTLREMDIMVPEFDQFDRPKVYNDVNDVHTLEVEQHEGLVVVTKNFDRIKIKVPDYVKKSYMFPLCVKNKGLNLYLHVLKVVQENEEKEFCRYCPEYANIVVEVKKVYDNFIMSVKDIFDQTAKLCSTRRDFAVYIQKYDRMYHKYLFALYDRHDLYTFGLTLTTKRLYSDLFMKNKIKTERKVNDYGYTPDNKYGKFAEDVKRWEIIQIENSKKIVFEDVVDVDRVRYVGGLDISFDKTDDTVGVAYITIYDINEKKIVYEEYKKSSLTIPYISGFLGFREVPEYVELLNSVRSKRSDIFPDVLMLDGFGVLHHRGFGSASHIGFETNIPTIGVAKTLLFVDGLDEHKVKNQFRETCKKVGDCIDLVGESGKVYGVAYKSAKDAINPIYVTIGHNISLKSCIRIVELTTKFRIPEPIRNSDIKSKLYLK